MAKFTATAYINNMASRLGYNGSHCWSFYGLARGTAWCAAEISYTFNKIGAKAKWYGGKPVFYVPYAQVWMEKNYKTIYDYRGKGSIKDAKKGDIIIFMFTIGSRDHIGAVRLDSKSSSKLYTIEGNTSGGQVAKRTREKKNIFAVYRPPYKAEKVSPFKGILPTLPKRGYFKSGDKGGQVEKLQKFLIWNGESCGHYGADGDYGTNTASAVSDFQIRYGLSVDGAWGKECQKKAIAIINKTTPPTTTKPATPKPTETKKPEPKPTPKPEKTKTNAQKITAKAKEVAYKYGTKKSTYSYPDGKPTSAYKSALAKAYPDRSKWGKQTRAGASCDVCAGTIIRASGVDKKFPRGLDDDYIYLPKSDKFKKVSVDEKSDLKAGDIIIYRKKSGGGHICIYIGDGKVVEAGYVTKRYPCTVKLDESRLKPSYRKKNYNIFGVYRAK